MRSLSHRLQKTEVFNRAKHRYVLTKRQILTRIWTVNKSHVLLLFTFFLGLLSKKPMTNLHYPSSYETNTNNQQNETITAYQIGSMFSLQKEVRSLTKEQQTINSDYDVQARLNGR